ncbi:MAG: glycosyltransferase family 4 protein [Desulfobacteraceae bacterium]|nr:MAG: glycosyltransferase family 4 protein [Desulfobacteraceae bacterium]
MNICMFTNTYLPHVGGVARSVDSFATDLRQMGHEVLVIAPQFNKETPQERGTVRLPALQHFNGSDFAVRIPLPFVVEREIEAFAPDIIHSHHPFLLGDTALRVAKQKRLPLVFTHHTLYEQYTHYVPLDSDRLETFVISLATLYANYCDQVVAPSRSLARTIQARGVRSPISIITTGVDAPFFANGRGRAFRAEHGIAADAPVVGHVGRLAAEKNLDWLARAVRSFVGDHAKAVFLVVGSGPCRQNIADIFAQAGLEDRLIMTGQLTDRALADAYRAMDLFVFASFSETQGMVLAEAMAAGLPVIALEASGVRDIVDEDRNGRLLPAAATMGEFAGAIQAGIADPARMRRWRTEAIRTARRHSRPVCARKLADLYMQVLQRRQSDGHEDLEDMSALESLVSRIKLEWALFAGKVKSAVEATASDPPDEVAPAAPND